MEKETLPPWMPGEGDPFPTGVQRRRPFPHRCPEEETLSLGMLPPTDAQRRRPFPHGCLGSRLPALGGICPESHE